MTRKRILGLLATILFTTPLLHLSAESCVMNNNQGLYNWKDKKGNLYLYDDPKEAFKRFYEVCGGFPA